MRDIRVRPGAGRRPDAKLASRAVRRGAKLTAGVLKRDAPEAWVDLGASGARVQSAADPGEVKVVSRSRRQATTVEPPAPRPDPALESDADRREVTVITGARWRDARVERPVDSPDEAFQSGADRRDPGIGSGAEDLHDTWGVSGARRAAAIVGSRAREAILGYPYPAPAQTRAPTLAGGAPGAGVEPAPGQTVVLVGDDVEAWVRERLYGGRLPDR